MDSSASPAAAPDPQTEHAALEQLGRFHGERELTAAILALLLPSGSRRAERAWRAEVAGDAQADAALAATLQLSGPARLPCLEVLLGRMAGQPLASRQALLTATRRVMGARGTVRAIDRLHWLAMRESLGGVAASPLLAAQATARPSEWPDTQVANIAVFTAFLSRMVPHDDSEDGHDRAAAKAWYDSAMVSWPVDAALVSPQPPDVDALVRAWHGLRELGWMQRPVVVRCWVEAAVRHRHTARLSDSAADALRLSCTLLECPLPPDLARHYGAG